MTYEYFIIFYFKNILKLSFIFTKFCVLIFWIPILNVQFHPKFGKFRDILLYTVNSVFMTGFYFLFVLFFFAS